MRPDQLKRLKLALNGLEVDAHNYGAIRDLLDVKEYYRNRVIHSRRRVLRIVRDIERAAHRAGWRAAEEGPQ